MLKEIKNAIKGHKRFQKIPIEIRFWEKVNKSGGENACWIWEGAHDQHGYGQIWYEGKSIRAARIAYFLHHGEHIPKDLDACHTCDTPSCVNPSHIWAGTPRENTLDSMKKGRWVFNKPPHIPHKTHCVRGHALEGDNIGITSAGSRFCKTCMKESRRRWEQRNKN